ncbi:11276_t:CDS:2 [Diversispora eburnea]|uniref:11276_t:CDS:1 n=1 Tax=Diversispora eburnea TaxID=1213867 RepID=A0A9N9C8E2_9GLOM|nr:11276_t:CDS:2 [Diversispora eburnea]
MGTETQSHILSVSTSSPNSSNIPSSTNKNTQEQKIENTSASIPESEEAYRPTPSNDEVNAAAAKIAYAFRKHRKSREGEGKILSAKSRDAFNNGGTCSHMSGGMRGPCPVWSQWEGLLNDVEEYLRNKQEVSESRNTNQKFGLAVGVIERITKGNNTVHDHLWLILDTEHWLEICDCQHRYGSNLKVYHDHWLGTSTPENFFDWLDKGGGKSLSLKARPRHILDSQRVKYLTITERLDYEVTFKDGLLIYKKSGKYVHTNPKGYDEVQSKISPMLIRKTSKTNTSESTFTSLPSPHGSTRYTHTRDDSDSDVGTRGKWIYVSDCEGKFYVGQKIKGQFHHSSFLSGGAIRAAGGIKIYEGRLLEINPRSGHYKPAQDHFKNLIKRLREEGIDVDSKDVKVIYPDDIMEKQLLEKYHLKRFAEFSKVYDEVIRDAENMIDSMDRQVTKVSIELKKNTKEFLKTSKKSIQTIRNSHDIRKSKSKHERKSSGFLERVLSFIGISDNDSGESSSQTNETGS